MSVVISFKRGMYKIIDDDNYEFVVIDDEELRAQRSIIQKKAERELEEEIQ